MCNEDQQTTTESIIREEIHEVERIIADETWYEGERRGCFVGANDPVVLTHVYDIITKYGMDLHKRASERLKKHA